MLRIKRQAGFLGFAGVYHSHVNQGAYISAADESGIAFTGLYIVASVINGVCKTVKCFHWNGQYFSIVMP
jgi:proteasome lid subunit RPN8/RPN11